MTKSYGQFCALARALDHVGDRWTLLVVRELLVGPCRYSDLRAALPGVATNLLADRLRQLEANQLVVRRQLPPPAASAVYELTPLGAMLDEPVYALIRWGAFWMLAGRDGDAFEPRWLVLALRALAGPVPPSVHGVVDLLVEDARIRVTAHGGAAEVALAETADGADAHVLGDVETLLGVVVGVRSFTEAARSGQLRVTGDRAIARSLVGIFATRQPPHREHRPRIAREH